MRRRALCIAALVWASAGEAGAQQADGKVYTPGPFDGVEISGSATIDFVQGTTDQVVVQGGEDAQRAVTLAVRGGMLRIDPAGSWKFWDASRARIQVSARELKRVSISGAANFQATGPVRADALTVTISGAGRARFDQLETGSLDFRVSGSGDGQLAGSARDLHVRISGRSDFRGEELRSEHAVVSISGVGDVKVWATQDLEASVAGVGRIDYWGAPVVRRSVSGAATITDRGAKVKSP